MTEKLYEPFSYVFNFENGSVGAWSSYPPAQDTAYDPTIWVKTIGTNPTHALVREIIPNHESTYTFGMRKKLDICVNKDSILSFKYFVKNYRNTETVIIKLGFGDGCAEQIFIPVSKNSTWEEARLSFKDIVPSGFKKLKAVGFQVICPSADPEAKLKFAIDDVLITGFRKKTFKIESPAVRWLEELFIHVSMNHYAEKDEIVIQGQFPVPVNKASITIRRALTDQDVHTFKMKRGQDKTWTTRIQAAALGCGLWKVDISGTGPEENPIRSSLVFLIRSRSAPADHPWLLTTKKEKPKILEQIQSGCTGDIWKQIRQTAENMQKNFNPDDFNYNLDAYDEIYWLPTYSGYAGTIRSIASVSRTNGLVYFLTGDKQAGETSKKTLLKMAEWPSYVHPHILNQGQFTYWPAGLTLLDLALGYDT
ncbi:MAG: hypothetical protein KAX11_10165, partial [Candidatus Aminicenantes bacterium]|nr:hypothetical protein [Candidatus Aminicenantes bacterium]